MGFFIDILNAPLWVIAWLGIMGTVMTASVFFLKHRPAKIVLLIWGGVMVTMLILYQFIGYVRLLGIVHVLMWTPLVIYLVNVRSKSTELPKNYQNWLLATIIVITISLLFDYVDVARYLFGETGAISYN